MQLFESWQAGHRKIVYTISLEFIYATKLKLLSGEMSSK